MFAEPKHLFKIYVIEVNFIIMRFITVETLGILLLKIPISMILLLYLFYSFIPKGIQSALFNYSTVIQKVGDNVDDLETFVQVYI